MGGSMVQGWVFLKDEGWQFSNLIFSRFIIFTFRNYLSHHQLQDAANTSQHQHGAAWGLGGTVWDTLKGGRTEKRGGETNELRTTCIVEDFPKPLFK